MCDLRFLEGIKSQKTFCCVEQRLVFRWVQPHLVAVYLRRRCSSVADRCPLSATVLSLLVLLVPLLVPAVVLTVESKNKTEAQKKAVYKKKEKKKQTTTVLQVSLTTIEMLFIVRQTIKSRSGLNRFNLILAVSIYIYFCFTIKWK